MNPKYSNLKRIPGMPNYYRGPTGKIYFRMTIGSREQKIATETSNITLAQQVVAEELPKLLGQNPILKKLKLQGVVDPRVRDSWAALVSERGPNRGESTVIAWDVSWRHGIEPFWGDVLASEITQSMMSEYEKWYFRNRADKVADNVIKHLGMVFRYMRNEQKVIDSVPIFKSFESQLARRQKRIPVGRVLTSEEERAIFNAIEYAWPERGELLSWPHRAKMAVLFCLRTGCRKKEMLAVRKEDVNFELQNIRLWSFKNKKWREIPLAEDLRDALKEHIKFFPKGEWLFPRPRDPKNYISSQILDKSWVTAKSRAEILGRLRFHDLRHTFATRTVRDGWAPVVACKVLDMSLKRYLSTYCHMSADDIKRNMMKSFKFTKSTGGQP